MVPFVASLKSYSTLLIGYAPLVQLHGFASDRFEDLLENSHSASSTVLRDATRARLGTIFNVTLAEIERLHRERHIMISKAMFEWLNQSIESQQDVLKELVNARDALALNF